MAKPATLGKAKQPARKKPPGQGSKRAAAVAALRDLIAALDIPDADKAALFAALDNVRAAYADRGVVTENKDAWQAIAARLVKPIIAKIRTDDPDRRIFMTKVAEAIRPDLTKECKRQRVNPPEMDTLRKYLGELQ